MGWTVLYIAFGFVALWLLGEVLLQYKARLRWRLLAFVGFLGVVIGVLMPSVVVIAIGAIAFATGQTYVTLSFRRGFSTGWALGGAPGLSKRRRQGGRGAPTADPTLEVSDLEYETPPLPEGPPAHDPNTVFEPQPMPDDTGQYGVYADASYSAPAAPVGAYGNGYEDPYAGYDQQQFGYDAPGQQQYAAYSDPYIGTQGYSAQPSFDTYGDQQQYAPYGDGYGGAGYSETPPGGVWVPQQRTGEDTYGGELPPEQPYPYQNGTGTDGHGTPYGSNAHDVGYNEQYRY
ncbi:hypothetical protein [Streptomyces sp. NPDC059009]|uniref:hypothetical protein n=1 Tax=Streptomyces sp. NPDC059009 TaxID=3346694 RepID=UPI003676D7E4